MGEPRAAFLVGRREIRERLRSRAFRISTVIQVLAVVAIAVALSLTGGGGSSQVEVGYIGEKGLAVVNQAETAQDTLDVKLEAIRYDSRDEGRIAVADGDIEALLTGETNLIASDASEETAVLLRQSAALEAQAGQLRELGLSEDQLDRFFEASSGDFVSVEAGDGSSGEGVAFIATLLLYIALIFAGTSVSSGVIEEKSTRVVELIITAIKPRLLLAGKVVGIGLIGLSQLLLIIIAGLGTTLAIGDVDLPEGTFETAVLALLYFVLGYILYGCAFAVAGSLVSRQEDAQSSTAPVILMLVAAYLVSISATGNPSSVLAQVGTYLPPIAPMVVPARAGAGELPWDQLVASLALMVLGCLLLIWIAGRVYEQTVLRMGVPVSLREIPRMLRGRA